MAKILILANNDVGIYKFRLELIKELLNSHEVIISVPNGTYVSRLTSLGCKYIQTPINRRGTNPISEIKLIIKYFSILKSIKPDLVLTYTIKPNVYGGLACRIFRIPYITNITGLGTAIQNPGILQKITLLLYSIGLKKASTVFFQNNKNMKLFVNKKIVQQDNFKLINGSGVNLEKHSFEKYPIKSDGIRFLYVGRLMKEKGIEELLQAAEEVKKIYPKVYFDLIGINEENYSIRIAELEERGIIKYHGLQDNVHKFIKNSHAIILPSHHEGMSNVLLESAATGRPVLASEIPGCLETFDEGVSGFGFKVKDVKSLVETIIKFINLPNTEKEIMGIAGRNKMVNEFDREIIVNTYLNEIKAILKEI